VFFSPLHVGSATPTLEATPHHHSPIARPNGVTPLPSFFRPSSRASPRPHRLPWSAAYTSLVRTPRSFRMPCPLSSCATTPRSIIERRLAMVPHHRGAGVASPSCLCSVRAERTPHVSMSSALAVAWAGRCAVGHSITWSAGPRRYCASGPCTEASPLDLFCFSKFSDLVQIIANFKNLHRIHLTLENYETKFVG
jgi:hypothetical protein